MLTNAGCYENTSENEHKRRRAPADISNMLQESDSECTVKVESSVVRVRELDWNTCNVFSPDREG